MLIIFAGAGAAGYWYYTNYIVETPKAVFFKYVGQNNIREVIDLDVYYNMLSQLNEKSFLMETMADFTTTMKNDFTENIDSSKFDFAVNIASDKTYEKSRIEAKVAYSSNDLFSLKLLSTKENIGIYSEDIFDKYIVSSKDELDNSIKIATAVETDISANAIEDTIKNISNNRIDITDEYKTSKALEYSNVIYNLIPEESVTKKENIVVTINSENVNTDAYTLDLGKDKYQEILKTVLEKLRDDNDLLGKIVDGKKLVEEKKDSETEPAPINTITPIKSNEEIEVIEGKIETHESELIIGEPETDLVDTTTLDTTVIPSINLNVDESELEEESNLYEDLIKVFITGQKISGTMEDLKSRIDDEIVKASLIKEGITITIYVRNEEGTEKETIKLVSNLQDETSIDIEYISKEKFKVTYLSPEVSGVTRDKVIKGSSVEVEKQSSDVNLKYNIQKNSIENKKIVSKAQIELTTDTSNPSKGYTNSVIIKYNNSDGDLKVNVKNDIKFQSEAIAEDFSEANSIFLDRISSEEAQNLYIEIFQKVMEVYAEKVESLTFIDNNSSNSIVQQPIVQPVNTEEKEEIRSKLIDVVSNMMGEAESRGEIFTIENLKDLSIDGYDVSSIVSSDLAIIKINGYTFNIDKDFMLSE